MTYMKSYSQDVRARMLIEEALRRLHLDLSGITVLTEMGSGQYIFTPLIAVLAGASHVFALVKDSRYGGKDEIAKRGNELAGYWGVGGSIEVIDTLSAIEISQADIVTNLGFIRPIDDSFIARMKSGAVIPYMREAWEYRPGDVDLAACRRNNIPVMGTYEDYDGLAIFDYCGPLAAKILFEVGIEVKGTNILLISNDRFGDVIEPYLHDCGASIWRAHEREQIESKEIDRLDALLVACFQTDELILGAGGWLEPKTIASWHPECTIIQFVGNVDAELLAAHHLRCIPDFSIGPHRMAMTLADLGPKPVIELHGAGLKVSELMWRKMQLLGDAEKVETILAKEHPLCQRMDKVERSFDKD